MKARKRKRKKKKIYARIRGTKLTPIFILFLKRETANPPKKPTNAEMRSSTIGTRASQKPKKEIDIYPNLHAIQLLYTSQATTTKKTLGSIRYPPPPPPPYEPQCFLTIKKN